MIDQPTIDRILDAANIVDVVSEFVTLRKRGINYVGLCPFHTDKNPSFYVSPAKNICKCFACGEGGTAVHFIMKHEQIGYFDALRYLAKKYNIEIEERELTEEEKKRHSDRESMLIINQWAQQYFTSMLYDHEEGRTVGLRYFAERGFRNDTIRKFQLGYSPDRRDALYKEATKNGYKKEYLEKTGLVVTHDNGSVSDRFRCRVIFPVHTLSGKVVAFGGRVLKKDEKTAKYVNSPESEIYHKSNELYGIYFAKKMIMKEDRCFLVEGYTDVISMHQAGIENVVASSGTALTKGQIRLIQRFTKNITVLYDGDAAGIKAALRGIDLLLEDGMNVKVVLLPDGEDPDSFARKHNAGEFAEFIKESEKDFIIFKTNLLLGDAGGDPIQRSMVISKIVQSIAVIPDNISRSVYIRECSATMEIDEQVVLNEVNKIRLRRDRHIDPQTMQPIPTTTEHTEQTEQAEALPQEQPQEQPDRSPFEIYELMLLRYIVRYGERLLYDYVDEETNEHIMMRVAEYIRYDLERDDLTFYTPLFRSMLDEAAEKCTDEGFIARRYFLSHPDSDISRLAADLISDKYQLSKYHSKYHEIEHEADRLDQFVIHDIYALKNAYILRQIKEVQQEIKTAQTEGNEDAVLTLMKQLTGLNEKKNSLSKELGERTVLKM